MPRGVEALVARRPPSIQPRKRPAEDGLLEDGPVSTLTQPAALVLDEISERPGLDQVAGDLVETIIDVPSS